MSQVKSFYPAWVAPENDVEVPRLLLQHTLQQWAVGRLIIPPLSPHEHSSSLSVLDVGCGPSHWLLALAELYPEADLCGIDITGKMFPSSNTRPRNVNLFVKNILQPLPAEWHGKFDLVNTRHLMFWIPEHTWDGVLRNMMSVLKPGGWIQLVEHGAWYPHTGAAGRLNRLRSHIINRAGLSPEKIPTLPSYIKSNGFISVSSEARHYPIGDKHPVAEYRAPSMEVVMPVIASVKNLGLHGEKIMVDGVADMFPETDKDRDRMITEVVEQVRESGSGILYISTGRAPPLPRCAL